MAMTKKLLVVVLLLLTGFLTWRFIRPMNIFVVEERFAWPVETAGAPTMLGNLSAEQCGSCHTDFYREWQTTIHSQAWTDPYFQSDWQFDGEQHNCRLCHTPLDRQQPQTVLAYLDADKWQPVLEDNPAFDAALQHEGVTCAACHYRNGKIVGVLGNTDAPHAVKKIDNPNRVCVRCHIVEGERWDTFFRFPPCGTVAEINATEQSLAESTVAQKTRVSTTGEMSTTKLNKLGCVQCHMPLMERPLVAGGEVRKTRRHLWRGGHDPAMVKSALAFDFSRIDFSKIDFSGIKNNNSKAGTGDYVYRLTITNTGAAHFVPTGTPDRHLTVQLRLLDAQGRLIDEQRYTLKRTVMWRPFIIDLWDTRLRRWQPQQYEISTKGRVAAKGAVMAEAVVKYHLLDEARRQRIGYANTTPVDYEVFRKQILLPRQQDINEMNNE